MKYWGFLLFAENENIIAPDRGMELLKVQSILNLWARVRAERGLRAQLYQK